MCGAISSKLLLYAAEIKDKEEEALHEFNMEISQDEKHFSAWSNKVILLDELDRLEEAKIAAERAKLIFSENADFYFHLGNILGKQSHFEKAEKHYHEAIHILDKSPLSKNSKTQSLYRSNLGVLSVSYTHLTLPTNREV